MVEKEKIREKVMAIHTSPALQRVLELLESRPMCASELARAMGVATGTASVHISKLRKLELVDCITPERRNYRIYALSKEGEVVLEKVREYQVREYQKEKKEKSAKFVCDSCNPACELKVPTNKAEIPQYCPYGWHEAYPDKPKWRRADA